MEIYVSTDVETDGPIPGPHSMLSFGSAAFNQSGKLIDTFSANLHTLEGAKAHPDTENWWKTQPVAWEICRKDLQKPEIAMKNYVDWVNKLAGKPVFVAYPAGFDFMFMYWYMIRFANYSPFSFSAIDMKTVAMVKLNKEYRQCTKRNFPKSWFSSKKHTHAALDDAIEQGEMFCKMIKHGVHPAG